MFPIILAIVAVSAATMASASSHHHPLDPLSASELTAIRASVLASPAVPAGPLHFHYVGLDEPDKPDVLSHYASGAATTSSPTLRRRAFVIARAGGQSHEFIVDVTDTSAPSVVSHAIHHGPGFPMLSSQDQAAASALLPQYPPFMESLRRRGLNTSDVGCGLFSMGWFGNSEPAYGGGRLAKLQCFVRHVDGDATTTANVFARPLDGVTLVVDLDRVAIVGYKDRVVEPVPKAEGTDYRADKLGPPFTGPATVPGVVVQPEGSGICLDGHLVRYIRKRHDNFVSYS
jgi:primary-amine oxidase